MTKLEARRAWVFDQLLSLLRNSNMTKQDDWVWSILEFLLVHGLFVVSKANKKSNVSTVSSHKLGPAQRQSADPYGITAAPQNCQAAPFRQLGGGLQDQILLLCH